VGYTEVGNVFMVVNAMMEEKPVQLVVTVTAEEAVTISKSLITAADQAVGYKGETIQ
jgi:hypothetical protein